MNRAQLCSCVWSGPPEIQTWTGASLPILLRCPSRSFHHLAALPLPSSQNDSAVVLLLGPPCIFPYGISLFSVGELRVTDSIRPVTVLGDPNPEFCPSYMVSHPFMNERLLAIFTAVTLSGEGHTGPRQ